MRHAPDGNEPIRASRIARELLDLVDAALHPAERDEPELRRFQCAALAGPCWRIIRALLADHVADDALWIDARGMDRACRESGVDRDEMAARWLHALGQGRRVREVLEAPLHRSLHDLEIAALANAASDAFAAPATHPVPMIAALATTGSSVQRLRSRLTSCCEETPARRGCGHIAFGDENLREIFHGPLGALVARFGDAPELCKPISGTFEARHALQIPLFRPLAAFTDRAPGLGTLLVRETERRLTAADMRTPLEELGFVIELARKAADGAPFLRALGFPPRASRSTETSVRRAQPLHERLRSSFLPHLRPVLEAARRGETAHDFGHPTIGRAHLARLARLEWRDSADPPS